MTWACESRRQLAEARAEVVRLERQIAELDERELDLIQSSRSTALAAAAAAPEPMPPGLLVFLPWEGSPRLSAICDSPAEALRVGDWVSSRYSDVLEALVLSENPE